MRVVLDTNVWLSGLMLPASLPGQIVRAWRSSRLALMLSDPLFEELSRALRYPKIRARLSLDDREIERWLAELRYLVEWVDLAAAARARVPRDHRDDPILTTFIASRADALVTGDRDLLELAARFPILTPREFVDHYLR
jgi:putative PIN family toxin of toxin-antitoxin system